MWFETLKISPSLKQIFSPKYIPLRISAHYSFLAWTWSTRGSRERVLMAARHYYLELLQTTPLLPPDRSGFWQNQYALQQAAIL
jgi:hypothetical protein